MSSAASNRFLLTPEGLETDPARLNKFLDEITEIKLKALEQLTDETLRGDRVFSIFLMQCANLINKLQFKPLIQAEAQRKIRQREDT